MCVVPCVVCGKGMETVDHLFIHCEFSHTLWCRFLLRCSVLWCSPGTLVGMIEAWRCSSFHGCGLVLWRLIPFAMLWSIWKERNERVFRWPLLALEDLTLLVVA